MDMMDIVKPTFVISESRVRENIRRMMEKADASNALLRPHFKTHQSLEVGKIYRDMGINSITVSSIDMALEFAEEGWDDITIAFPVNIRQIADLNDLTRRISLHLLVESLETITFLSSHLEYPAGIWIGLDVGYHRTGVDVEDHDTIVQLAEAILRSDKLKLRGVLTHAGHSYTNDQEVKTTIFTTARQKLTQLKHSLAQQGIEVEISYGDTPTCSVFSDFSDFNEIRPGNFAFYDLTQLSFGSCSEGEISVALACPVVAIHHKENKIVVHGGGVHFSKDKLEVDSTSLYGYLIGHNEELWQDIDPENYLFSLSQDHGLVRVSAELLSQIQVGDILYFYPVHSCMTANLMKSNTLLID